MYMDVLDFPGNWEISKCMTLFNLYIFNYDIYLFFCYFKHLNSSPFIEHSNLPNAVSCSSSKAPRLEV